MNLTQAKNQAKNQIKKIMLSSEKSVNEVLMEVDQIKPATRSLLCGGCGNRIVIEDIPDDVNIKPGAVLLCSKCAVLIEVILEDMQNTLEGVRDKRRALDAILHRGQRIIRSNKSKGVEKMEVGVSE